MARAPFREYSALAASLPCEPCELSEYLRTVGPSADIGDRLAAPPPDTERWKNCLPRLPGDEGVPERESRDSRLSLEPELAPWKRCCDCCDVDDLAIDFDLSFSLGVCGIVAGVITADGALGSESSMIMASCNVGHIVQMLLSTIDAEESLGGAT